MGRRNAPEGPAAIEWLDGPNGAAGVPGGGPVPGPRPARRLGVRGWAILTLVAALVAGGFWYGHRSQHVVRISYAGRPVDGAGRVLQRADAAFTRYAAAHHGALGRPARCYFGRFGAGAGTDVGATLFCGPVLFYGDAAAAEYLRYPTSPSGAAHDHVNLTVAGGPVPPTPQRLPREVRLLQADGRSAPSGTPNPAPPPPPPAPVDALVRVAADDVPGLAGTPSTAVIGSRNVQVTLKASGVVSSYGHGARARSAAPGQRLIAFEVEVGRGEVGSLGEAGGPTAIGISVDGEPARSLPLALGDTWSDESWTRFLVAAAGVRARTVDLVVFDAGITQRLDLLTGTPGVGNLAVLARDPRTRFGDAPAPHTVRARVRGNGEVFTTVLSLDPQTPALGYFSPYGSGHAAGPDRALLSFGVYFRARRLPCPGSSCGDRFGAANERLLVAGRPPIRAVELSGQFLVFEVPASFRSGTAILTGTAKTAAGWTVTLLHPLRLRITFPSG